MAPHDSVSIARRGEQLESIAIAFLALAWLFVVLRVWTRTYVISNFGWDDATMVLAGMVFTVYCTCILHIEAHGGGTHVTSVAQLTKLTKWAIASEATYVITILILKVSLGIFFSRIIVKHWQLILIHITIAVSAISSTASFFYIIFRCGSSPDNYVFQQLANNCAPRGLDRFFAYQNAAFSTLTDIIFATLPFFILWNTSMDRRSKISVGIILSLAALGCICSAIRFPYVDGLTQIEDFFWNATNISVWSTIELGTGIIAGSMATLRPLVKRAFTKAQSIRSSASRSLKQVSSNLTTSKMPSSKQKTTTECTSEHATSQQHPKGTDIDLESQLVELIELRSEERRKGESTEYILSQSQSKDSVERWWPSRHGTSLELDRTSSRTTRSRAASDPTHHGSYLSPIPQGFQEPA